MIKELFQEFLVKWPTDKAQINSEFEAAKIYKSQNPGMKKSVSISENSSVKLILEKLPAQIQKSTALPNSKYKFQGSVGQGNLSEVPWICIFDRQITESAQTGYYIVFLFDSKMDGFYLSLNQGWTQYTDRFGKNKFAREQISANAKKAQTMLRSIAGFSTEQIVLNAEKTLGKGYEDGNICCKYYSKDSLPNDEDFLNDLNTLIGVYRELKGLVGLDILQIAEQITEDEFQAIAQEVAPIKPAPGPIKKKQKVASQTVGWVRSIETAATAIWNADHKCENDPTHMTFQSAKSLKNFVEAHHLIPMEFQADFEHSIDVPENVISLCPTCHRAFHFSEKSSQSELIDKFFDQRKDALIGRGLSLTMVQLKKYYGL